jgi:hypothetical protein
VLFVIKFQTKNKQKNSSNYHCIKIKEALYYSFWRLAALRRLALASSRQIFSQIFLSNGSKHLFIISLPLPR